MATLLIAALLGAAAAPAAGAIASETHDHVIRINVAPTALFALAERLAAKGAITDAEAILTALGNDPDPDIRNEARFRQAKLLEAQGLNVRAAVLLRGIVDEKPAAMPVRLELAQLLDRMGDKDSAWRQMRAIRSSGLPPAVARLVDRYSEALRAQRAQGFSLEIAIAPDSNINAATRSDTLGTIFGDFNLDENSRAKSGTGLSLQADAFRRLPLGGSDASLLLRFTGLADLYRHSAFNDVTVDLGAGPELMLGNNRINLEAAVAERWFGQKPFSRSARLDATLVRPLGGRTQLRLSGTAGLVRNQWNPLQSGKSYSGRVELERALSPTTGIGFNLGLDRQALRDPGYATTGWRGGLIGWHDMGRVTLTAEADFGRLHADERLSLFPEARADRYSRFALGASFRQLQFGGFAPLVRFSIERNRSTVGFYDYKRRRTEFGIVRAF